MLSVIKKRYLLKRGMAFLMAMLMILNQNILVRAEVSGGDSGKENKTLVQSVLE